MSEIANFVMHGAAQVTPVTLERMLRNLPMCLNPGGRAAILTFHSGEDRRVKKAFQEGQRFGLYAAVTEAPVRPGPEERRDNPRSAPAKLRWAVKAEDP